MSCFKNSNNKSYNDKISLKDENVYFILKRKGKKDEVKMLYTIDYLSLHQILLISNLYLCSKTNLDVYSVAVLHANMKIGGKINLHV